MTIEAEYIKRLLYMKYKIIFVIVFLLILGAIFSFAILRDSKGGESYINAKVLEVKENTIVVEIIDGGGTNADSLMNSKNPVTVSSETVNKSARPNLNIGDEIRIVYNSDSVKKEPLRIEVVFAIYLLNELE